ncbi:MAG TPA: FtsX-like permease family protein [Casimicrobiaceae bacterium]|nr:FtsX-like permease family protein [Casimicrobiaceae bacterium]
MRLGSLALAYARRRPLATLLVVVLFALGTAVIVLTLILARELQTKLQRDAQGIDLVVGAKGSPLQLVLAGVYHVDVPPGNIPLESVAMLRANPMIASAIPLALGDSYAGYRIVGTEPALIDHYRGAVAQGRVWTQPMEAVLGSDVARETAISIGATFAGSHGLGATGAEHGDAQYSVVGVLAPTGTVLDRMVLTSIESVWAVHDTHQGMPMTDAPATTDKPREDPSGREVTLVLVRYIGPLAAARLPREINQTTDLVAASPAYETARLLSVFGVGIDVIRAFAALLIGASALMLFVALAQAMDERRYDLAILRALGANRGQVAGVLLSESLVLACAGTIIGVALAHVLAATIGAFWAPASALSPAAWRFIPEEGGVVAIALGAGILAAAWPAWQAYRLDVAATLADS